MRYGVAGILTLLLLTAAWASNRPDDKPDPAEQLKALQAEMQKARTEILTKYREAK